MIFALALPVLGCGLLQASKEDQERASRFFTNLVSGDTLALARDLDTSLTSAEAWPKVLAVRDSFLLWEPDSLRLIGWNVATFPTEHVANLTYQFHSTRGWLAATVNMKGTPENPRIRGFHWQSIPDRLDRLHRFSFTGKPLGSYLVVALAIAMAIMSLGSAVLLVLSDLPRRWAWAALCLVGCTRFDLNWTTGATAFQSFTLQLFSAGFQRASEFAPWIISVSFPFGAMLAWRKLLAWKKGKGRAAAA